MKVDRWEGGCGVEERPIQGARLSEVDTSRGLQQFGWVSGGRGESLCVFWAVPNGQTLQAFASMSWLIQKLQKTALVVVECEDFAGDSLAAGNSLDHRGTWWSQQPDGGSGLLCVSVKFEHSVWFGRCGSVLVAWWECVEEGGGEEGRVLMCVFSVLDCEGRRRRET